MSDTFFISDQHFGHAKFLTFKNSRGDPIRNFNNVSEMNEHIIKCHNSVVSTKDDVYMLGDVGWYFNNELAMLISRLNGRKFLCAGNHDNVTWLARYFDDVYMWHWFKEHSIMASHVPMNNEDIKRVGLNVHGHTHDKYVTKDGGYSDDYATLPYSISKKHYNVCVEVQDYHPVSLDELLMYKDIPDS